MEYYNLIFDDNTDFLHLNLDLDIQHLVLEPKTSISKYRLNGVLYNLKSFLFNLNSAAL